MFRPRPAELIALYRGLHAGGDADAIPGIDGDDGHDHHGEVLVTEEAGSLVVGGVGDVVMADQGDLFGERQDGSFFGGEEWCFTPGVEGIDALFGFAVFAGVAGMHVDTKGAAVDLGRADIDQVFVGLFEASVAEVLFHGDELAVARGFGFVEF